MLCPDCFEEKGEYLRCSHCGFDERIETDARRLPLRSRLKRGQYLIGKTIGHGGFGLTYKAFDAQRYRAIVIVKECLLSSTGQVTRAEDKQTLLVSAGFRDAYRKWLSRFCNEAKRISQFKHSNIVRIVDFFEENNTAYYVMPLVDGVDLRGHLERNGGRLSEAEVLSIAEPLISAIGEMHRAGIVHRDIKPQNIILTKAAMQPVLIDFGAAIDRSSHDRSLSSLGIQTEGYSPIEQVTASSDQGPWTDIYSLAATFYRCLAGVTPIPADKRFRSGESDQYVPIEKLVPSVSIEFARLINKGLAYNRKRRISSAAEMIQMLPTGSALRDTGGMTPHMGAVVERSRPTTQQGNAPSRLAENRGERRVPWGWFTPSAIGLLGVFTTSDKAAYLTGPYLWLVIINLVAWAILTTNHQKKVSSTIGASQPLLRPSGLDIARQGRIRFLDDEMAGRVFSLAIGDSVVVGRSSSADISINNPLLSKQHVQVRFVGSDFEVTDLGSTNGTFVLDYSIDPRKPKIDRIRQYVGSGTFCLGPYEDQKVRFECLVDGIDARI